MKKILIITQDQELLELNYPQDVFSECMFIELVMHNEIVFGYNVTYQSMQGEKSILGTYDDLLEANEVYNKTKILYDNSILSSKNVITIIIK